MAATSSWRQWLRRRWQRARWTPWRAASVRPVGAVCARQRGLPPTGASSGGGGGERTRTRTRSCLLTFGSLSLLLLLLLVLTAAALVSLDDNRVSKPLSALSRRAALRAPQRAGQLGRSGHAPAPGGVDEPRHPLVSVVVTAHNAASTLGYSVTSLLRQTHQNIEVIIVDDASSDGSADIADALARNDSRVRVLRNERNIGTYASRNVGVRSMRGSVYMNHDADDYALPHRVAAQLRPLLHARAHVVDDNDDGEAEAVEEEDRDSKRNGTEAPRCAALPVDMSVALIVRSHVGPETFSALPPARGLCELVERRRVHRGKYCCMAKVGLMTTMYRASVFADIGLFDEQARVSGDAEFAERYLARRARLFYPFGGSGSSAPPLSPHYRLPPEREAEQKDRGGVRDHDDGRSDAQSRRDRRRQQLGNVFHYLWYAPPVPGVWARIDRVVLLSPEMRAAGQRTLSQRVPVDSEQRRRYEQLYRRRIRQRYRANFTSHAAPPGVTVPSGQRAGRGSEDGAPDAASGRPAAR